jgi:hypothetical protein
MWFKLQISLQNMDLYCVGIIIIIIISVIGHLAIDSAH